MLFFLPLDQYLLYFDLFTLNIMIIKIAHVHISRIHILTLIFGLESGDIKNI